MLKTIIVIPPFPDKERLFLLGPGYVAAAMKKRGHEAVVIDEKCASFESGAQSVLRKISDFAPDVIGVSLISSHNILFAYDFVKELKKRFPGVPLVAGGLHSTLLPGEVLEYGFDYAVMGDGEHTFPELAERLTSGKSAEGMEGVSYIGKDGKPVISTSAFLENIDGLDWPENRIHTGHVQGARNKLLLMISRGCFRSCSFCVERRLNRGGRYRNPEAVMAEIRDAVENHGVRELHFVDSSFLEKRALVEKLCEMMIEAWGENVPTWRCLIRVDHLDEEILSLMYRAGCRDMYAGMESANQDTLDGIRKGIKVADNERAAALCHNAGISLHGYFMAGLPWETAAHYEKNMDFVKRHGEIMDFMFSIPVPYPCTKLYEDYHQEYGFTDWWKKVRLVPAATKGEPLYKWIRSRDPVLAHNFFKYDNNDISALEIFLLENRRGAEEHFRLSPVSRLAWNLIYVASVALNAISPALENAVMKKIYRMINDR